MLLETEMAIIMMATHSEWNFPVGLVQVGQKEVAVAIVAWVIVAGAVDVVDLVAEVDLVTLVEGEGVGVDLHLGDQNIEFLFQVSY